MPRTLENNRVKLIRLIERLLENKCDYPLPNHFPTLSTPPAWLLRKAVYQTLSCLLSQLENYDEYAE